MQPCRALLASLWQNLVSGQLVRQRLRYRTALSKCWTSQSLTLSQGTADCHWHVPASFVRILSCRHCRSTTLLQTETSDQLKA